MVAEQRRFAVLLAAKDLDGLIARYQLRRTACYAEIASKLLFQKLSDYESAVVARVEHDDNFKKQLEQLLDPAAFGSYYIRGNRR